MANLPYLLLSPSIHQNNLLTGEEFLCERTTDSGKNHLSNLLMWHYYYPDRSFKNKTPFLFLPVVVVPVERLAEELLLPVVAPFHGWLEIPDLRGLECRAEGAER